MPIPRKFFITFTLISSISSTVIAENFTQPIFFQAFAPLNNHEAPLTITEVKQGYCTKQSLSDRRFDAWRCESNGQIYDPCFQHGHIKNNVVLCPDSPWSTKAIKMITASKLDNSNHKQLDVSKAMPWAVELTDGTKCINIHSVDSKSPYKYHCQNQQYLVGNIYRCKAQWEIYRVNNGQHEVVTIKSAWF